MHTFTGDNDSLRIHWDDEKRAKKFLSGGTRAQAVSLVLEQLQGHIKNGVWIDVATGAGYVQKALSEEFYPSLFVGIDLSQSMLRTQSDPLGQRIQGTVFALPIRRNSSNIVSIFFSLSDYPDLDSGTKELERTTERNGIISFTDYGKCDEYWQIRKSMDGKIVNGQEIKGNINLRTPEAITQQFSSSSYNLKVATISYDVDSSKLTSPLTLPGTLRRCFSFVMRQKK